MSLRNKGNVAAESIRVVIVHYLKLPHSFLDATLLYTLTDTNYVDILAIRLNGVKYSIVTPLALLDIAK